MIAALFVESGGVYFRLPDVDPWDKARDARLYSGPHPVVAHPPCERWGRYWHGSPMKPHQFAKGDDGGCFAAALEALRKWGGVLEHPAYSHAWFAHGLPWPPAQGWQLDLMGGWCCYVEQGWYGHKARKPTWLYATHLVSPPTLRWGRGEQRLDPRQLARYGRKKASRMGIVALMGGGGNSKQRSATPTEFRDRLLAIARECRP